MSISNSSPKPTVAILLTPAMRKQLIPARAEAKLAEYATVTAPAEGELAADTLPRLIGNARAVVTGWGTPPISEALLATHNDLKLVAHAAGSVRHLVPFAAIEEGRLAVTHSAIHIGEAVCEYVMAHIFSFLRHPAELDAGMKAGEPWLELRARLLGRLLGEQTVGLVGAGYIGRMLTRQLKAFNARVLMHDPFLSPADAKAMDVELASISDVFSESDIVSLHVPSLPETRHMIGKQQLAQLKDGALFINTARGAIVDEKALIEALGENRFTAVLDVYEKEPLANDSPFRLIPNARIAPHAAGHTHETYRRQGAAAVDEVCRFLAGEPFHHEVTKRILATMA
jgi:phosphoglycerate dehydrogenase-like enzyme